MGVHRIGDWYPERNIFQFLIALNSGTLSLFSFPYPPTNTRIVGRPALRRPPPHSPPNPPLPSHTLSAPAMHGHNPHSLLRRLGLRHLFRLGFNARLFDDSVYCRGFAVDVGGVGWSGQEGEEVEVRLSGYMYAHEGC